MSVNSIPKLFLINVYFENNWTEVEQERILDYLSSTTLIKHVDEFLVGLELDQGIKDFIKNELVKLATEKELLDWFVNDLKLLLDKFLVDWESMSFEESITFFNHFSLLCTAGYEGLDTISTLSWIDSLKDYKNIQPELQRIKKHFSDSSKNYFEFLHHMSNNNLHSSIKSLQVFADYNISTKIQSILVDLLVLYYKLKYTEKAKEILSIGLMYARDLNDTAALATLLNWTKILDHTNEFEFTGDPFEQEYLNQKALLFKKQGKTAKQLSCLQLADNDYSNNQVALGSMLETSISLLMKKKGNYKECLRIVLFDYYYNTKQYKLAQELIFTDEDEWKVRQGLLYYQYGDYDKLDILASSTWGLVYLSMIYIENNQLIKAQSTILKAIVDSKNLLNSIARLVFSLVLLYLNQTEKAKNIIEAVELDIHTNADNKWKGYCFYIKGLIMESDLLIKEALKSFKSITYVDGMSNCFLFLGDLKSARDINERVFDAFDYHSFE
ncbi:hypothetical protein HDV01_004987 [Terramyces sp. JEL0728]|nr:hypothetical protein HDV01_004987 [Terramyces sp. JEL0728]